MYKMDDDQEEWNYNEFEIKCSNEAVDDEDYDCCGECDGDTQVDRIQLRAQIVAHLLPYYNSKVDDMLDEAKRLEYFILNGE